MSDKEVNEKIAVLTTNVENLTGTVEKIMKLYEKVELRVSSNERFQWGILGALTILVFFKDKLPSLLG